MISYFEILLQDTKNFAEKQIFTPFKAKINIGVFLYFSHFFRTFEVPIRDCYFYSYQLLFFYYFYKFTPIVQQHCIIAF